MKKLLPLLLLISCTEHDKRLYLVEEQIKVEHKANYAKACVKNECVCFAGYQLYSQTTIPCSFYDKIEVKL